MITDWAGVVWKKLPPFLRRGIVRLTQASFTVSATVFIRNSEGRLLLLDHTIRPSSGWGLPGGFLESGEQPAAAVLREVREETGLELKGLRLVQIHTTGSHIEILFAAASDGEVTLRQGEIKGFGWFQVDQLPADMGRAQKERIVRLFAELFEKPGAAD